MVGIPARGDAVKDPSLGAQQKKTRNERDMYNQTPPTERDAAIRKKSRRRIFMVAK